MSSRRAPSTSRLSPLQGGRSRRRSSRLGMVAAIAVGLLAVAAALVWLLA
jgi:hypothetical protein